MAFGGTRLRESGSLSAGSGKKETIALAAEAEAAVEEERERDLATARITVKDRRDSHRAEEILSPPIQARRRSEPAG